MTLNDGEGGAGLGAGIPACSAVRHAPARGMGMAPSSLQ